jgi:hypothetical protein
VNPPIELYDPTTRQFRSVDRKRWSFPPINDATTHILRVITTDSGSGGGGNNRSTSSRNGNGNGDSSNNVILMMMKQSSRLITRETYSKLTGIEYYNSECCPGYVCDLSAFDTIDDVQSPFQPVSADNNTVGGPLFSHVPPSPADEHSSSRLIKWYALPPLIDESVSATDAIYVNDLSPLIVHS